jgi:nitrogen fixation-related uncharacterized protein
MDAVYVVLLIALSVAIVFIVLWRFCFYWTPDEEPSVRPRVI